MCVFLGSICLKIVVERWFWKFKMLFGSLVELHALLHSYLCFSLLEKLILSYLYTSSIPPQHLAICRDPKLLLIVISTDPRQLGGSIEKVPRPSIASRHLVDWISLISYVWYFCTSTLSRHLYLLTTKSLTPDSTPLNTFICQDLLRFNLHFLMRYEPHFSRSLSQYLYLFTSQTSLTHSYPLSQGILEIFQKFLHLVGS